MDELALAAATVRGLSMDCVEAAKSGHPGMPMGAADYATTLFLKYLNHSPADPAWPNRDRFVLSAGHGAVLLYSLLHLSGYDLPVDELKRFRQWDSRTPGHPERGHTPGVETTTGPLGQGCANAVGMALAERMLAERFNVGEFSPVDHYTYVICSDGDLMEGISHEAFALAGHLALHKLIAIYDDNRITIEGSTDLAYSDDVRKRFEAYHWNVIEIDGHDFRQIADALDAAKRQTAKPTFIIARTHIAHGAPNAHDSAEAHGAPLGEAEVKAAKKNIGLPENELFHVPEAVRAAFAARRRQLEAAAADWQKRFQAYRGKHPDKATLWDSYHSGSLPAGLTESLPVFTEAIATRAASGKVLQTLAKHLPNLVGGSADLAPSNNTMLKDFPSVRRGSFGGRNLHFGIREHGMAAILNGMALHGGFRVYGATFLVFVDYCRPSVRLAALMKLPVVYVFTHDSFFVGEDGPTHQPVEHAASLRCIPNMTMIRPADAAETTAAWLAALKHATGPTALLLTRQKLPILDRTKYAPASGLEKGAYVLWQSAQGKPDVLLLATGSEVHLALDAATQLAANRVVRVVSMPSWELFEKQAPAYRNDVIPADCPIKIAVEAARSFGWDKYVGPNGYVLGIDRFGASAPQEMLAAKFGFTAQNIVSFVKHLSVKCG